MAGLPEAGPPPLRALGKAGAAFVRQVLDGVPGKVVGLGHGRSLAACMGHLPRIEAPGLRLASLLGGQPRLRPASSYEVMQRLVERTGAEAWLMPVPFFAGSADDREVLLRQAGVRDATDFKWASDPSTAMFTVVLVDVWVYTLFMIVLLLAGLRILPQQPFEAAQLDGVPAAFAFFRITLPMLTPCILTATLFRLLDAIQQFDIVFATTQSGPGDSLMVFQVRAYLTLFQYTNVGQSAAILMVLWAITYALGQAFIKQWHRLRREAHGHA